jgi:NADH-quinone oxidoreductase subunit C
MSDRDDTNPDATPPPETEAGGREDGEASSEAADGGEAKADLAAGGEEPTAAGEREQPPEQDEEAKKEAAAAAAKAKAAAAVKAKAEAEAAKPPWERDPAVPEWQEADDDPLAAALSATHGDGLLAARTFAGDLVLDVARGSLRELAADLKQNHGYDLLVDICGAHYPQREEGVFEVIYHLYSIEQNRRVRLKVTADEDVSVPSVVSVWVGADWPEREAWDMFGIRFADHPDLTRILMWEGFNGHPLRKEFPVEGIDTGAAIYPEYYGDEAGPVAGTGTGWKPPAPPEPEPPAAESTDPTAEDGGGDAAPSTNP